VKLWNAQTKMGRLTLNWIARK